MTLSLSVTFQSLLQSTYWNAVRLSKSIERNVVDTYPLVGWVTTGTTIGWRSRQAVMYAYTWEIWPVRPSHFLMYNNCLRKAPKANKKVRWEDSSEVVVRNMRNVRIEDDRQVQSSVIAHDDQKRTPYLFYFDSTHLLI